MSGSLKWCPLNIWITRPKWLTYYCQILNQKAHFKHWISYAPTAPMGKSLQPAHYGTLFYVKDPKDAKIYPIRMPHERERKSRIMAERRIRFKSPMSGMIFTHGKYRDDHPCQLPVALLERMILLTTDEGDLRSFYGNNEKNLEETMLVLI